MGKHTFYFKEGDNPVASTAEAEDFSEVIKEKIDHIFRGWKKVPGVFNFNFSKSNNRFNHFDPISVLSALPALPLSSSSPLSFSLTLLLFL